MPRRYPPISRSLFQAARAQMLDGDAEGLLAQIESELRIARLAFEEIQHAAPVALDELRLGAPIATRNSLRKVGGGLRLFLRVIGRSVHDLSASRSSGLVYFAVARGR